MMLVTRLVLVVAALVLLARGHHARTPVAVQQEVFSPNTTTDERHRVDKDETGGDHRQGRMALHAEAPSSKVKREQALRNILAARRRQLLGPKVSEAPKNLRPSPRTPRPAIGVSKDPLDMLEAQETRHGVYVTAPIGDQVAIVMDNDEGDTVVFANEDVTGTTLSSISSSPETIEKSAESADRSTRNSLLLRINETSDKSPKNVSQASSRGQKSAETEARRKNTVAMPESLYNHFRPVESNIPVEDMTQFLYFGQKIQPESHNGSTPANNSILDAAATSASVPIARRRYSMKRFSTTTPIPVPRLEEIVNEEMNIALERSTIERNKIPKTKNVFRSPGSGTYFRKSAAKATDQTIVSNVIPTRESARNASAEADAARPSDSSANANQISQVGVIPGDLGIGSFARSAADNAPAHRARNTTAASLHSETETGESDDNTGKSSIDSEQLNSTGKTNDRSKIPVPIDDAVSEASTRAESSTVQFVFTTDYESTDEKSNKITTWQFVHTADEVSTSSPKIGTTDFALTLRKIGNLAGTPDPTVPSSPADATTASLAHSSLRIVVTEPIGYDRRIESATSATWLSADEAAKDSRGVGTANGKAIASSPVNQADSRKDRTRQRIGESARPIDRHLPAGLPSSQAAPTATATGSVNSAGRVHNTSDSPPASGSLNTAPVSTPVASSSTYRSTPPAPLSSHPRQQHAYAYEITNVTRLLRNYTGPGLSGVMDRRAKQEEEAEEEEEDGRKKESEDETPSRSEGEADEAKRKNAGKKKPRKSDEEEAAERGNHEERGSALTRPGVPKIRNDGGPTPQSPLPLLLLPTPQSRPDATRSSGGTVEPAARTPGALSAGTDVDGATAGATSGWNAITSTGSAPITRSGGGNSGARASRTGDSSQSPSASSSSSSSASSSSSSSSSTSSSSSSTLVGERGRKGAHGARQQYHQLNQNRGIAAGGRASALSAGSSSSVGTRNVQPSASGTAASVEVSGAVDSLRSVEPKSRRTDEVTENTLVSSTVRWNHTGVKKLGGGERAEGYGYDRRYLRKSVSAVLNQRPIEEGLVKELKRRRESTLQAGGSDSVSSGLLGSLNSRRTKGSRAGEDARSSVLRSMENTTVSARGETTAGQSSGGHEDAIGEEPSEVGEKVTGERSRVTGDPAANVSRTIAPRLVTTEANIETTVDASGVEVGMDLATRASEDKGTSGEVGRGRDQSDERANLTEVTPRDLSGVSDGEGTVANGEGTREASTDSATTSTTSTTSRDASTSAGNTEAPETTTSSATPAFPVTPRMLKELKDEASKGPETGDPPTDSDQAKPEASRPFGLAKDLDPSEIQKMYRSQTTVRPDLPMTTIIPETSTDPSPEDPATRGKGHPSTASPVNSSVTRKPIGGERSPEVRGRNLSDKIKDKDDVLPIMQLYNTSGIFNGTAGDAREAASAVSLPGAIEVNATRQPSDSELTATLVPDASESSTRRAEESPGGAKHQRGNSDDEPAGGTKRNRNQGSREESRDSNGPGRSTNHTGSHNSYGANRTRHRPTYQPPEFIGYRPEFNGSFFEPGMISVSSRESVNVSEVITKRHDGDTIATQETVAVVSYILATLIVFPIAVGVGLILRRLIIRNRKVLEESDTSSEISCRKDALNLENGDFKTSIEKAITKLPRIQHLCHEAEKPPPPPSQESRWEFPRDKLRLQTVLGQGNFGQVWKAEADDLTGHQGTTRLVAVKTVKEGASAREKEDLIRELEIMQQLGNHSNVVTLLGCCTEEEPHYLILEYVMYGKLLAYLRDHRTRQDFYNFSEDSAALTSRDLTVFGYCVARGMEYLASKKIIHRDLAARNVLVDHNKLCKIADFGMSRFANDDGEVIEARHGRNALPIRWMAPESLIYSLFTTKTDVWSFGILMWEIVTLGSTPYPDMAAREVMRNVQNGYRLERPSHCRSELFRVIARCWHADPDRRPEFQVLRRDMAQLLEDSMNGHYVDLESFASECTD